MSCYSCVQLKICLGEFKYQLNGINEKLQNDTK